MKITPALLLWWRWWWWCGAICVLCIAHNGAQADTAAAMQSDTRSCAATATRMHSAQVLLSRKRRYIFWTPGSAILATMSFAKAIATKYPRGVNIVAEADFFYPLPTKITDWYPTTKKPPVAKTPKLDADINTLQYVPLLQPSNEKYSLRPNDYWHRSPIYIHAPASSPSSSAASPSITRLSPSSAYAGGGASAFATSGTRRRQQQQQQQQWYPRPAPPEADRYYRRRPAGVLEAGAAAAAAVPQPATYSDWRHHRGYRERRDLYTKFETMATEHGLDIRGCLLRMICEAKHYLLPHGKSFFHDVLRILFYVPVQHSRRGEEAYADAMRSTMDDCASEYRRECRYSILGLLLSREKYSFS